MVKKTSFLPVGMLLACLLLVAGTTRAATYTVTNTTDCSTSGCGSLRQALMDAFNNAGADTINFASGVTGTITLANGDLIISDPSGGSLAINGPGASQLTIDGNQASRIFQVISTSSATISGLTIVNGHSAFGGGVVNMGTLTLVDSVVRGNSSDGDAGGILNLGTLTLMNSTVSGNTAGPAGLGGGILNEATLTVTNSTISGNSANDGVGGGIVSRGMLDISSSTIVNNSANGGGGGVAVFQANVKNSIIANSPSGGDCFFVLGMINASGVNYATDGTCPGFTEVTPAQLNLGALALSAPGRTETHALEMGSVAIDTVTDCTDVAGNPVTTDQRGVTRPQVAACDAGSFEVAVAVEEASPEEMLVDLRATVRSYCLRDGLTKSLVAKLNAALAALAEGDTVEAAESVQAFIDHVNDQRGKKIRDERADQLVAAATEILEALE